jgi:hypothetical protein
MIIGAHSVSDHPSFAPAQQVNQALGLMHTLFLNTSDRRRGVFQSSIPRLDVQVRRFL